MATTQPLAKVFFRSRFVAYLVRSLRTNARIRSLTTGTFNLVVKDRIALRLSGANSVRPETHKCTSGRPRNPTNIPCGEKPCQSAHPTEFPLLFHNGKCGAGEPKPTRSRFLTGLSGPIRNDNAFDAAQKHATVWPSASRSAHFGAGFLGRARAEDRKLRKELALEVPCFEGTLQRPDGFRIASRGRDN